jgi:hypothetical protein
VGAFFRQWKRENLKFGHFADFTDLRRGVGGIWLFAGCDNGSSRRERPLAQYALDCNFVRGSGRGPLGTVSVLLVVLQPTLFNAWCTLCLASAVISILMIGPAMDEVLASLQHVKRETAKGRSFWRVFWGLQEKETEMEKVGASPRTCPVMVVVVINHLQISK